MSQIDLPTLIATASAGENFTHAKIHFPDVHTSSLVVNQLEVVLTAECAGVLRFQNERLMTGFEPVVRYTTASASDRQQTTESQFFPSLRHPLLLHSHSASSPFGSVGHSSGLDIEIWQNESCPVEQLHISPNWRLSFAKIVIRYRMTIISWMTAWTAIVIRQQLKWFEQHSQSLPRVFTLTSRCLPVL